MLLANHIFSKIYFPALINGRSELALKIDRRYRFLARAAAGRPMRQFVQQLKDVPGS